MNSGINQAGRRMLSAISEGRILHACFISCPDLEMAEILARKGAALYCTGSSDPVEISRTRDCIIPPDYRAESIRELIADLSRSSFSGGRRAVLLINAHKIAESTQNLLLKTIEEPPDNVLFLITGNPSGLLPTILSRCAAVICGLPSPEEVSGVLASLGASAEEARLYAAQGVTLDCSRKLWQDEDYRALRDSSQNMLLSLLTKGLTFEKQQTPATEDRLRFMLSLMRDILNCRERGTVCENFDKEDTIRSIAPSFTSGRISSIIELLVSALERINIGAAVPDSVRRGTMTRLFTEITEEL